MRSTIGVKQLGAGADGGSRSSEPARFVRAIAAQRMEFAGEKRARFAAPLRHRRHMNANRERWPDNQAYPRAIYLVDELSASTLV